MARSKLSLFKKPRAKQNPVLAGLKTAAKIVNAAKKISSKKN